MKVFYGILTYTVRNEAGLDQKGEVQAIQFLRPGEKSGDAQNRFRAEEAAKYPDAWECYESGWETREITLDFLTPDMVTWMQTEKQLSVKTILAIDFALPHVIELVAEYGETINDAIRKHPK